MQIFANSGLRLANPLSTYRKIQVILICVKYIENATRFFNYLS